MSKNEKVVLPEILLSDSPELFMILGFLGISCLV